jgi:hypothetical protein
MFESWLYHPVPLLSSNWSHHRPQLALTTYETYCILLSIVLDFTIEMVKQFCLAKVDIFYENVLIFSSLVVLGSISTGNSTART